MASGAGSSEGGPSPSRGSGGSLRFDQVTLTLGKRSVLRGVSFAVEPGEVVGLLGRNGAGKTTLLRIAARAVHPDSGAVFLSDQELGSLSRRELARRVAVVPQETQVPFPFRAGELVLMGRAPYQTPFGFESAEDLRCAQRAMDRVGIGHLADRVLFELSGGERQLTIFARALAQDADLLLLDEPTAFLDLRHRIEVLEVVREFAASGRAALVVSHDLTLAARVCDRLVLLADGVVAAQGPPDRVLTAAALRAVFAVQSQVMTAPDGAPIVVPRISREPER